MSLSYILAYSLSSALIIAVILIVVSILKKKLAKKKSAPDSAKADPLEPSGAVREGSIQHLKESFAKQNKLLKRSVSFKDPVSLVPWFLTIGTANSGKSTAVNSIGNVGYNILGSNNDIDEGMASREVCNWRFYKNAVVLDVKGYFLFSEDGLTSNEKEWHTLLQLLQKYRPHRPLDGIVLTIDCSDLLVSPEKQAESFARITQKADVLFERLWHVQRVLGVRFPVYVMVTKCDMITGFSSFCHALPVENHDDIFGWSNPYAIETSYTSKWVNEAFDTMRQDIFLTKVDIFATKDDIEARDEIFLFPEEFNKIKKPLQIYIDNIFKKSAYHEAFIFRGLYFTGVPGTDTENNHNVKPIFLNRLFDEKIFVEYGLARMPSRIRVSKNRRVIYAQICAILILITGVAGLSFNYMRLNENKDLLLNIVKPIENLHPQKDYEVDESVDLLTNMSKLNVSHFWSIFYPTSWFDHVNDEIVATMTIAFDKIIMTTISKRLKLRVNKVVDEVENRGLYGRAWRSTESGEIVLPYETSEFKELKKFITELHELEININKYNKLQEEGEADLHDLEYLFHYLYEINFSEDFYGNAGMYHESLAKARSGRIQVEEYIPALTESANTLANSFFKKIFRENVIQKQIDVLYQLSHKLVIIDENETGVGTVLRDFHENIVKLEGLCSNSKFLWLTMQEFGFEPYFIDTLSLFNEVGILDEGLGDKLLEKGRNKFRTLTGKMKSASLYFPLEIFEQETQNFSLKISAGMVALKEALDSYFAIKPVPVEEGKDFKAEIPAESALVWNVKKLEDAAGLSEMYSDFSFKGIKELERLVNADIKNSLKSDIYNLLTQAQEFEILTGYNSFSVESNLKREIDSFKNASPYINKILQVLKENGFIDLHEKVLKLMRSEMSLLLAKTDKLVKDAGLFGKEENIFSKWNCTEGVAFDVFKVNGDKELKSFLQLQIDRLRYIVDNFAEPVTINISDDLIALLSSYEMQRVSALRSIVSVLRGYDNKEVDNELRTLENYLRFDINKIKADNYQQKTDISEQKNGTDSYFGQMHENYNTMIRGQCGELIAGDLISSYSEIEEFFNTWLSGYFPFSSLEQVDDSSSDDAEYEDVKHFYRMFHKEIKQIINLDKVFLEFTNNSGFPALQFVKKLDEINDVFHFYSEEEQVEKQRNLALNIEVFYRVNREYEIGVNQIIDWDITVDNSSLKDKNNKHFGVWNYGDDIEIVFRWAKDSNVKPSPAQMQSDAGVDDKNVVYRFPGRWSLIKLLKKHAVLPSDFVSNRDIIKPHTIKFTVDTKRKGLSTVGENKDLKSIVFLRVNVFASSDKGKQLIILPEFPVKAPLLSSGRPQSKPAVKSESRQPWQPEPVLREDQDFYENELMQYDNEMK